MTAGTGKAGVGDHAFQIGRFRIDQGAETDALVVFWRTHLDQIVAKTAHRLQGSGEILAQAVADREGLESERKIYIVRHRTQERGEIGEGQSRTQSHGRLPDKFSSAKLLHWFGFRLCRDPNPGGIRGRDIYWNRRCW